MRTKAVAALAAIVALAALPAAARPDAVREVTIEYQGPNTLTDDDTYISNTGPMAKPQRGETAVEVEVLDDSGRPVLAAIHQGNRALGGEFCGSTPRPVSLVGRGPVHVHLYAERGCGDVSLPTHGTIVLSFRKG